jgi:hypothetical protein
MPWDEIQMKFLYRKRLLPLVFFMAFCPTQLHWATLDQKASGGSPRLSDLNALTPNGSLQFVG